MMIGLLPAVIANIYPFGSVVFGYACMGPLILCQFIMTCLLLKTVCLVRRAAVKISYNPDLHITNVVFWVGIVYLLYICYVSGMFFLIWNKAAKTHLEDIRWIWFYQTITLSSVFQAVILCMILYVDMKFTARPFD